MFIPEIHKAINVFEKIDAIYNKVLFRYLNLSSTQRKIIGYNHSQLEKGIKSDGSLITPFYASLKYKGRRAPVDLYLEGNFYRSFKIEVFENTDVYLFIFASDRKANFLKGKYDKKILGLTENSIDLFVQNLIPYFKREMPKEIKKLI